MSMASVPTVKITYGATGKNVISKGWEHNTNYTTTFSGSGEMPTSAWTSSGFLVKHLGYAHSDTYIINKEDSSRNLRLDDFQILIVTNTIENTTDIYFVLSVCSGTKNFTNIEEDFYKTHKLIIMVDDEDGNIFELELNPLNSFNDFKQYNFLKEQTINDKGIFKNTLDYDCMIFMTKFSGQNEIDQIMKDNYLVNDLLSIAINQPERTYSATYGFEYREL